MGIGLANGTIRTINDINGMFYDSKTLAAWYKTAKKHLLWRIQNIQSGINKNYQKCEKKEDNEEKGQEKQDEIIDEKSDDKPKFTGKGTTPILDPSGYVYEAVTSNRLEGVTVTCYQKVQGEDMYGDNTEETVVWNAEDYSQKNPLKTDADGLYSWDVPQGWWQVKYEKEGYETTYSEWLPVPPPQLDVNVGMTQSTPPTVKQMRGFESGIIIEMSKYMLPETLNESSITVTHDGWDVKGSIEMLNEEQAPLSGETYASKVKFSPESRFSAGDKVYVTVHAEVESYCNVKMSANHTEKVIIESEITEIIADKSTVVSYQEDREMRVQVLPKEAAAGKTLHIKSSASMIASVNAEEVEIDQDGMARFLLNGELPGGAVLNYSIDGTDISTSTKVQVEFDADIVATPTASIGSGETIYSNTLLELNCETVGATIYYTLDGSCPCNEQKRTKYNGPFTLPVGRITLQAIATYEGMENSDVATYIYNVINPSTIDYANSDKKFDIYYQNGCIYVEGAKGATCRVYDTSGQELARSEKIGNIANFPVPEMKAYVVSLQFEEGHPFVQKILTK